MHYIHYPEFMMRKFKEAGGKNKEKFCGKRLMFSQQLIYTEKK